MCANTVLSSQCHRALCQINMKTVVCLLVGPPFCLQSSYFLTSSISSDRFFCRFLPLSCQKFLLLTSLETIKSILLPGILPNYSSYPKEECVLCSQWRNITVLVWGHFSYALGIISTYSCMIIPFNCQIFNEPILPEHKAHSNHSLFIRKDTQIF